VDKITRLSVTRLLKATATSPADGSPSGSPANTSQLWTHLREKNGQMRSAYLDDRSIFFTQKRRPGTYLSFLSQSAFFFAASLLASGTSIYSKRLILKGPPRACKLNSGPSESSTSVPSQIACLDHLELPDARSRDSTPRSEPSLHAGMNYDSGMARQTWADVQSSATLICWPREQSASREPRRFCSPTYGKFVPVW
jgi:hypothetical protein